MKIYLPVILFTSVLSFTKSLSLFKACENDFLLNNGVENVNNSVSINEATIDSRSNNEFVRQEWILQRIDHKDPLSGYWKQQYHVNTEFYNPCNKDSPIFLLIGGEGSIVPSKIIKDEPMVKYAKKYGALIFQVEHRYYGLSQPYKDLSVENLKHLSSEQAIKDLAHFIKTMKRTFNLTKETQWIAFGCSYSGSLASWLRFKHPALIQGVVSVSAPLLAKVDFVEYFQVVWKVVNDNKQGCDVSFMQAINEIISLLKTEKGAEIFLDLFNMCHTLEEFNEINVANIIKYLLYAVVRPVQYRYENQIHEICDPMTVNSSTLPAVESLSHLFVNGCMENSYKINVERTSWEQLSNTIFIRQWTYQTCTEFGWYQTTHGVPLEYYTRICQDAFGPSFTKEGIQRNIDHTNSIYGGLNFNISNVVFLHGTSDPWYPLGMKKPVNPQATSIIVIEGTAHCEFTKVDSDDDPPQLRQAREQVDQIIGNWLQAN